MEWVSKGIGHYQCVVDEKYEILVLLDGELWRNCLYHSGKLIDAGEWDSRGVAIRNAYHALTRAREMRAPIATVLRQMKKDEDDD